MSKLLINTRRGIKPPNVTRIKKRLQSILKELSNPEGELSILFTGDAEIKKLNCTYRGVSRTTDVLSFPSKGGPGHAAPERLRLRLKPAAAAHGRAGGPVPEMLGDIAVSIPAARRQAKSIGSSLERETLFLLVHGLLHILGYDHERSKKSAAHMELLQKRLMSVGYSSR